MTDPMPRKDVELPPRMPEAATIAELQRALLDARAENARLRADAQAANGVWQANLRLQAELAAVEALRAERDRFEAALGRACLVGGTTYLLERAEKAEAERADEWRRRRDADASRDAAKAACETMRAERDAALARVEKLREALEKIEGKDSFIDASIRSGSSDRVVVRGDYGVIARAALDEDARHG